MLPIKRNIPGISLLKLDYGLRIGVLPPAAITSNDINTSRKQRHPLGELTFLDNNSHTKSLCCFHAVRLTEGQLQLNWSGPMESNHPLLTGSQLCHLDT